MNESTGNSYVNLHGYVHGVYFSDFVREGGLKMGMTEHEAILKLKDITQVFQAEDREEVDQMFYNQLTLDEIRDNLQEYNCLIGEIKQILREVEE